MGVLWGGRIELFMRKKTRNLIYQIFGYAILSTIGILFFFPLLWMVSTSLKIDQQMFVYPPQWIPNPITLNHYEIVLTTTPFLKYFYNTVYYVTACVIGIVISCSLVAYSLSCIQWPGREILFYITIATLMIPFILTLIPLFMIFKTLGWIGTYKPLIIPAYFGAPFYIFLLRQFLRTLPKDLLDAARIDGCSEFRIYWNMVIPLIKPALAAIALFEFVHRWNDFLGPLIYLRDETKYPFSLALQYFQGIHEVEWGNLMAFSTLVVLPVLIIFFFTQKTFIQGVKLSGIKG